MAADRILHPAPNFEVNKSGNLQNRLFTLEIHTYAVAGKRTDVHTTRVNSVLSFSCICSQCGRRYESSCGINLHLQNHLQGDQCLLTSNTMSADEGNVVDKPSNANEIDADHVNEVGATGDSSMETDVIPSRIKQECADNQEPADNQESADSQEPADSGPDDDLLMTRQEIKQELTDNQEPADSHDDDILMTRPEIKQEPAGNQEPANSQEPTNNQEPTDNGPDDGLLNMTRQEIKQEPTDQHESADNGPDDDFATGDDNMAHITVKDNTESCHDHNDDQTESENVMKMELDISMGTGMNGGDDGSRPGIEGDTHYICNDQMQNSSSTEKNGEYTDESKASTVNTGAGLSRPGTSDRIIDSTSVSKHRCYMCTASYSSKQSLRRHMKIHTGEAPVCHICGKRFFDNRQLKCHEESVHQGKLYPCDRCGKAFKTKSGADYHMKIHLGIFMFVCPTCGQGFNYKSQFDCHMNKHNGVKPYQCPKCTACFSHVSSQLEHTRSCGKTVRMFKCNECQKLFKSARYLKDHGHDVHTDSRKHQCAVCGKVYACRSSLRSHMTRKHGDS